MANYSDKASVLKSYDVDLSPLPSMPELTGTYNFSLQSCTTTDTSEIFSTNQNDSDELEMENTDKYYSQNKENIVPESSLTSSSSVYNQMPRRLVLSFH